jgi:hypothetical protein
MPLESLFSAASAAAMSGWLLLIVLPKHPLAKIVAGVVMPLVLSAMYLALIYFHFSGAPGGFGSLADVALLFSKQELLLAGWVHYLAFDLFIGAWEIRDSQEHEIPHLVMIPCLVMTFMLGPIGLLFYFAIRTAKTRSLSLSRRSLGEGGEHA